jgi:hypothetical protein
LEASSKLLGDNVMDTSGDVRMQEQEHQAEPVAMHSSAQGTATLGCDIVFDVNLTGSHGETRQEK